MLRNKKLLLIWDIAYAFFFVSFFISDIAFVSEDLQNTIEKTIRYLAYFLFILVLCGQTKQSIYRILICSIGIAFATFCTYYTRDLYYETLIFVIFTSYTIRPKHIIKISCYLLIVLTFLTVLASLFRILPMIDSPRDDGSGTRLGFGFYHSNVLPLTLFYIIAYDVMLTKKRIKIWKMVAGIIIAVCIYFFCDSKNGLISVMLLCLGCVLYRKRKHESGFLVFVAEYSIVVLSIVSLAGMLIQSSNSSLASLLNRLMTGRFGIAYRQYDRMGLHLINQMDWATYKGFREVIDNGYLYVSMRYGLMYLPFYWAVHIFYSKKNSNSFFALIVIIVVSLSNFIDNDLNSYGYIPFILLAFNKYPLYESRKMIVI